jgi:hypothetical protein
MQRALIVTGVLGFGTALVFAAAALTAMLFPNGTQVNAGWNGPVFMDKAVGPGVMMPAPVPVVVPQDGGAGFSGPLRVAGTGTGVIWVDQATP